MTDPDPDPDRDDALDGYVRRAAVATTPDDPPPRTPPLYAIDAPPEAAEGVFVGTGSSMLELDTTDEWIYAEPDAIVTPEL